MREDRRTRRRNETVREILDAALAVMAADGVAGLSLAEVARRMGLRPPSLYQYFPSRMAVYDTLFEHGGQCELKIAEQYRAGLASDPVRAITEAQQAIFTWQASNPVLAQLLHWRPVPGFEPSPRASAPAVRQLGLLREALAAAVEAGQLVPAAASDDGVDLYTVLMSGVISQQLANEPSAPPGGGRFTRLAPTALQMFFRHYAPQQEPDDRIVDGGRPAAPGQS